jgi:chemotaxis protein CheZ
VKQKVFRIEQTFSGNRTSAGGQQHLVDEFRALRALAERRDSGTAEAVAGLKRELATIRAAIARNRHELDLLINNGKERRMARAADELRASVDGMDHATQKILSSVEVIDDGARALAASLKTDYERGLAQDIQDHVVQIYEACNFQDLTGQRISNVLGIMTTLEDQLADILNHCNVVTGASQSPGKTTFASTGALLNGPKLDGDAGHASQTDIDAMFG